METDLTFFVVAGIATVLAGISKGGFGSGAAFVGVAMLAVLVPPRMALGIMLPLLMLIDLVTLRPFWVRWSWPDARLLLLGGVPGVLSGAVLFGVASEDHLRLLIGLIALVFVFWQAGVRIGILRSEMRSLLNVGGILAGVVAGFASFVSHAGGPVLAIYLLARQVGKTPYQATTVLVFGLLNVIKVALYAMLGMFTLQTLWLDLTLVPLALFGTWLGVRAHWMVSERGFFTVTYLLLTLTGFKLVSDALW